MDIRDRDKIPCDGNSSNVRSCSNDQFCTPSQGESIASREGSETNQGHYPAVSENSCAICLETPMKYPIVTPGCKHSFCLDCLAKSQETEDVMNDAPQATIFACPLCRSNIPHVLDMLCDRAEDMILHSKSANPVMKHVALLRALQDADEGLKIKPFHLRMLLVKVDTLMQMEKFEEVWPVLECFLQSLAISTGIIETLKSGGFAIFQDGADGIGRLLRFLPSGLTEERNLVKYWLDGSIRISKYHGAKGEWEFAKNDLESLLQTPFIDFFPTLHYDALTSYCYYSYHFGEYEKAIGAGLKALEMNRQSCPVYYFVALAYAESGRITEAVCIANQAMRHAVPKGTDDQERTMMKELRENFLSTQAAQEHCTLFEG